MELNFDIRIYTIPKARRQAPAARPRPPRRSPVHPPSVAARPPLLFPSLSGGGGVAAESAAEAADGQTNSYAGTGTGLPTDKVVIL